MPRPLTQKELKALLQKQKTPPSKASPQKTLQGILQQGRRIREKKMNKTETAFAALLEHAKKTGEILRWHFEEITLKIAPNTRYTPDFLAVLPEGNWHIFEIKGHLEDDASVKFKAASQKFPEITFQMLRRKKGQWETLFKITPPVTLTPHFNLPPADSRDSLTETKKRRKKHR